MSDSSTVNHLTSADITANLLLELYRNIHDAELTYLSGNDTVVNGDVENIDVINSAVKESLPPKNRANKRKLNDESKLNDVENVSRDSKAESSNRSDSGNPRKACNMEYYRETTVGLALQATLDSLLSEGKINSLDLAAIWDYYDECFLPILNNVSDKSDALSVRKKKGYRDEMNIVGKLETYNQHRGSLNIDSKNVVLTNGSSSDLRYKRVKLLLHS